MEREIFLISHFSHEDCTRRLGKELYEMKSTDTILKIMLLVRRRIIENLPCFSFEGAYLSKDFFFLG